MPANVAKAYYNDIHIGGGYISSAEVVKDPFVFRAEWEGIYCFSKEWQLELLFPYFYVNIVILFSARKYVFKTLGVVVFSMEIPSHLYHKIFHRIISIN